MKFKVKKIHHRLDFMDMTTIYEQFDQYQSTYMVFEGGFPECIHCQLMK